MTNPTPTTEEVREQFTSEAQVTRDQREAALRAWFEWANTAHPASTLGDRMDAAVRAALAAGAGQASVSEREALKDLGWTSPDDLPAHDRKIAAEALRGAANDMHRNWCQEDGPSDWLDIRADRIEQGGES